MDIMLSEETGKRIADALERLARQLEDAALKKEVQRFGPYLPPRPFYDPTHRPTYRAGLTPPISEIT